MVTSAKSYTKKTKKAKKQTYKQTDRQIPRTNGKSKAIQTKLHTEAYTYTLTKREKGKKNMCHCSQSPPPHFGMIRCLFRYSTDAGTSSCLWRFNLLLPRLLGQISLSLLCLHSSWSSALDLDQLLRVGRLRVSVLPSDRRGLKEQLIRGLWLTQAGGRSGTSLRRMVHSPGEVVPESQDPVSGGLHRLPGGAVWIVTCACTQASWWLQQQP